MTPFKQVVFEILLNLSSFATIRDTAFVQRAELGKWSGVRVTTFRSDFFFLLQFSFDSKKVSAKMYANKQKCDIRAHIVVLLLYYEMAQLQLYDHAEAITGVFGVKERARLCLPPSHE